MFINLMNPVLMCMKFNRHMDKLYEEHGKMFDKDDKLYLQTLNYKIKYAESFLSHKKNGKES